MAEWPPDMESIASLLVAPGRGILAADESTGTIEKRFQAIGIEFAEATRRAYRNLLFTTPGVEAHLSGVILFDETIRQAADDGTPFAELLTSRGMIPGIKVDRGAKALAGAPGEKVTEGLDGLRVVALDSGEILSTHHIEPDKGYWRNQRRDPGRWPRSRATD